ncbi:hypothetical protein DGo_PC0062 (plasmid) [Deinococcus gobiensis I-0]|uniref:Uncharacterized protein n=1 Tax=Deinococcus gobiensis (strain DSM 21396 / JCM 16679 / CGMCC 1.7299 / I-0) TaxID=745776 RepID=H8H2V7_DEIGI|nr:hypothetical protein DGo_PC0062 [Deinococcus gobiensis I-0]
MRLLKSPPSGRPETSGLGIELQASSNPNLFYRHVVPLTLFARELADSQVQNAVLCGLVEFCRSKVNWLRLASFQDGFSNHLSPCWACTSQRTRVIDELRRGLNDGTLWAKGRRKKFNMLLWILTPVGQLCVHSDTPIGELWSLEKVNLVGIHIDHFAGFHVSNKVDEVEIVGLDLREGNETTAPQEWEHREERKPLHRSRYLAAPVSLDECAP